MKIIIEVNIYSEAVYAWTTIFVATACLPVSYEFKLRLNRNSCLMYTLVFEL